LRVVFDTNIFVSAFVFPGSRADAAVRRVLDGEDELVISRAIIDELLTVLARKFARDADELGRVAVFLADLGVVVRPRGRVKVLSDEADNRILECARSGHADVIVTGDSAMLALGHYQDIEIKSLRDYLGS
jgi:putative PIN family toxin of toxin-antitoxin system